MEVLANQLKYNYCFKILDSSRIMRKIDEITGKRTFPFENFLKKNIPWQLSLSITPNF